MNFLMRRKQEDIPMTPVPFINPEDLPDVIASLNATRGNFPVRTKESDTEEMFRISEIAEQKGLSIQSKRLKRGAIASFLESRGMELLYSERYDKSDSTYKMSRWGPDGSLNWPVPKQEYEWFQSFDIKSFTESIPAKIIESIPSSLVDSMKVLKPARKPDPVIYIPITIIRNGEWWGIGIYYWG